MLKYTLEYPMNEERDDISYNAYSNEFDIDIFPERCSVIFLNLKMENFYSNT